MCFILAPTINNAGLYIRFMSSDVYSGGAMIDSIYSGGSGGGAWEDFAFSVPGDCDLYFTTYTTSGVTSSPYLSRDPGQTVKDMMSLYAARGGNVDYTDSTIDLAGYLVSYTFKINTTLEGIKKMAELAPADFYWYVDPAVNRLYFKERATTANHTFVIGKHIENLDLEYTVENIKNIVYFSGGDIGGGVNLFAKFVNTDSLVNHRIGLDRISDNRVTQYASAQLLSQDDLSANSTGVYRTTVSILEGTYDIENINLGQVVKFNGFGNFIDGLLLQIVGITRTPDKITLSLGTNPPRATKTVEALKRQLTDVQTIDNPSIPQ